MPRRIQRQRRRGWRMPPGAVYVGRPTKWGNPWRVVAGDYRAAADTYRKQLDWLLSGDCGEDARQKVLSGLAELRGKDLVCWCTLDRPCHADVLLDYANR